MALTKARLLQHDFPVHGLSFFGDLSQFLSGSKLQEAIRREFSQVGNVRDGNGIMTITKRQDLFCTSALELRSSGARTEYKNPSSPEYQKNTMLGAICQIKFLGVQT